VRRTVDWRDEAAVEAQLTDEFRPKYEMWNATFDVPYHVFRQRLKEIAQLNLGRVEGAVVGEAPAAALVVPVDDDDWFAPDVATRLQRACDPAMRGYCWTRFVLEARPFNPLRRRTDHGGFSCGTNNYAVAPEWRDLTAGHAKASRHFDAHGGEVKRLAGMLSLQNRNLSSQTVLGWKRPTISRARLLRRFRRYGKLYRRALPPELAWAQPYVERMAELMAELSPSS